ncbi:fused MFS/spermidine synthase [Candidatus Eisenbacteria bacterium]|uniref:Polyamine aminopropyltransferase n=1 Tax=Eiseniibacteriota bacterium TaxID=2212470 RepID=A0ABV6YNE9_UNCEI
MKKSQSYIAPVYILFLFSGATGLAYQVVWIRMLVRTFGATSFAISTVLAAYMAGLALGSYLFGRIIDRRGNPILLYGFLELGIGIFALLFPLILAAWHPMFRGLYMGLEGRFYLLSLIRFALAFSVLLIPTTLMGGTLPILSRYVTESLSTLTQRVGLLYSINTFGAVAGTFVTGFLLLPALGMKMTTFAAVAANVAIFLICLMLSRSQARPAAVTGETAEEDAGPRKRTSSETIVLVAFLFTGLAALSAEVIWSRVLTLVVGTTVYAFTIMLTTFLLGLALGSAVFSRIAQRVSRPRTLFAVLVLLIGFVVFATIIAFGKLPIVYMLLYQGMDPEGTGPTWIKLMSLQFLLCVGLMIVPTFLMGGTFPLVARIYAVDLSRIGARIGTAYAYNTVGSILGSFIGSFVLLQLFGVEKGMVTVAVIYLAVGVVLFLTVTERMKRSRRLTGAAVVVLAAVLMLIFSPGWDHQLMTSGVYTYADIYKTPEGLREQLKLRELLFYDEGPGATISVERVQNELALKIDGKNDASNAEDMITQELISHLPLLLHDDPDTVLMIGLGSGVSVSSAAVHGIERIDCIELLENVVAGARFFDEYTHDVLNDPRVHMTIGDGRNHVRLTDKTYDVIISQPTNPWISGVGDLFTVEYFEEARAHLKPGGFMTAWLALYHMGDEEVRSTLKSFVEVFPNATLWFSNEGDIVMLGSLSPMKIDGRIARRMALPGVREDLERVGIDDAADILSALLMDGPALKKYADVSGVLHTDDNMLIEFHAARRTGQHAYVNHLKNFLGVLTPRNFTGLSGELNRRVAAQLEGKSYTMMATVERERGNADRAIQLYEMAYETAPSDPYVASKYGELHATLAETLFVRQDWVGAMGHYARAVGNIERHRAWVPHDGLGVCYMQTGRFEEARRELETAAVFNPYNPTTFYNLGVTSDILGDQGAAIAAYEKALELDGGNVDAANNLAWIYAERGEKLDRALKLALMATGQVPSANNLDTLGWVYYVMGDYSKAATELERALGSEPQRIESIYHLGLVHLKSGNKSKARDLMRKVVQLDGGGEFASKAGGMLDGIGED